MFVTERPLYCLLHAVRIRAASFLFRESDLRRLLRLLDTTRGLSGYEFDPLTYIRIVNALQRLGKEKALAAISEYLRVTPNMEGRESVFLVLRILFDVPDPPGYMPTMRVGAPMLALEPASPRLVSRFPILIVDDVPLMVVEGYMLGGRPQLPEEHVGYFRKHGTIRARPLRPPDCPLQILADLRRSREWIWSKTYKGRELALVRDQWLRLVDSIYHVEDDAFHAKLFMKHYNPNTWSEAEQAISRLDTRWDPVLGLYTLRDGSYLKGRALHGF